MTFLFAVTLLCPALAAQAQQLTPAAAPPAQGVSPKSQRHRSRVSRPADFTGAGLLHFQYGYDGNFDVPDSDKDQAGTASVVFNATEDLQFELDFDTFHAQTTSSGHTATGIGDTNLGAQFTTMPEARRRPSLAFAYLLKCPTASESKGLGTGRVDHKLGMLASKTIHAIAIDANASLMVNGTPGARGWDAGYQLSLGLSRELGRSLTLQGGIFGETLDTDQPRGLFGQVGIVYQPTPRASVDFGIRAGLDSAAPRYGIVAGVSVNLAKLYGGEASGRLR